MKHIAYGESELATDDRLADLVLEYATLLAQSGSADTIEIPGRLPSGEIGTMSLLVGPASQITAWSDDEVIDLDVTAAVADVERRIRLLSGSIGTSDGQDGPDGIDDFDELA